jgi:disulfide bond formation protein DsbB
MTLRQAAGLGALVCAGLLGFAYYLQYGRGIEPCPLCLVQRGFYYAVMAIFVIAALHGRGALVYGGLAALFAAGGLASAGRQVWLQSLPPERVPQCGPDLFYMLDNFPLSRVFKTLLEGTGECAARDWEFLGLTTAAWSALWFVALLAYAVWLAARGSRLRHAAA